MDSEQIEKRLVDLELRYMRAEKMMQDLSDVLVAQQKTIDRMGAELSALRERVPDEAGGALPIEPPPHY
jgi:SlyX protein